MQELGRAAAVLGLVFWITDQPVIDQPAMKNFSLALDRWVCFCLSSALSSGLCRPYLVSPLPFLLRIPFVRNTNGATGRGPPGAGGAPAAGVGLGGGGGGAVLDPSGKPRHLDAALATVEVPPFPLPTSSSGRSSIEPEYCP